MFTLKIYLLAGLIAHKALWEAMKRRQGVHAEAKPSLPLKTRIIKFLKLMLLIAIVIQTLVPDVLPILEDPTLLRIIGVSIFTVGLSLAMLARFQLGTNWSDIEEGRILSDHAVKSDGVYRFIRHPIYVGDILLLIGLQLSLNSWLVLVVFLMTPIVLLQAIREEQSLMENLPGYAEYALQTKRFIPFII